MFNKYIVAHIQIFNSVHMFHNQLKTLAHPHTCTAIIIYLCVFLLIKMGKFSRYSRMPKTSGLSKIKSSVHISKLVSKLFCFWQRVEL